jgi:hypothetical protein
VSGRQPTQRSVRAAISLDAHRGIWRPLGFRKLPSAIRTKETTSVRVSSRSSKARQASKGTGRLGTAGIQTRHLAVNSAWPHPRAICLLPVGGAPRVGISAHPLVVLGCSARWTTSFHWPRPARKSTCLRKSVSRVARQKSFAFCDHVAEQVGIFGAAFAGAQVPATALHFEKGHSPASVSGHWRQTRFQQLMAVRKPAHSASCRQFHAVRR